MWVVWSPLEERGEKVLDKAPLVICEAKEPPNGLGTWPLQPYLQLLLFHVCDLRGQRNLGRRQLAGESGISQF